MKYYMESKDEDGVFTIDGYMDRIIDGEDEEIELFEMKRDIGGEMWCEEIGAFVELGDCGTQCSTYSPCNGKSGRCRNLKNGFVETGLKFLLTKSGLREIEP